MGSGMKGMNANLSDGWVKRGKRRKRVIYKLCYGFWLWFLIMALILISYLFVSSIKATKKSPSISIHTNTSKRTFYCRWLLPSLRCLCESSHTSSLIAWNGARTVQEWFVDFLIWQGSTSLMPNTPEQDGLQAFTTRSSQVSPQSPRPSSLRPSPFAQNSLHSALSLLLLGRVDT